MKQQLPRQLTLLNGMSLVVGTIIGSGIFASPGSVLRHAQSGGAALTIWACSGFLAFCGALCYAELAMAIPSAGGEVTYLNRAYGVVTSFLFTWTNVLVTRPAAFGIICIVFGQYLCRFIAPLTSNVDDSTCAEAAITKFAAFGCSILVTLMNAYSTTLAAKVIGFSTGMKVSALVAITAVGVAYFIAALNGNPINNRDVDTISAALGISNATVSVFDVPQALMSSLWAYDGWNGLSYAAEEMQNVGDVIRVIRWSVPLVTLLYFAANAAYIVALPFDTVTSSETVGVDLAGAVLGDFGRILMMLFVCVSAFGAAIGTVFAASRMVFSAARDGQLPACLSEVSETRGTPVRALILQWVLTCFYLFIGNFDELIGVFGSATWFFYFLTVLGLLLLRRREPDMVRPYRAPTIAAVLFCLVAIGLVGILYVGRPVTSSISFGFILLGLPFYFFYQSGKCSMWCCRQRNGWSSVEVTNTEEKEGFGEEALQEVDDEFDDVDVEGDDVDVEGDDDEEQKKVRHKGKKQGPISRLLGIRRKAENEAEMELLNSSDISLDAIGSSPIKASSILGDSGTLPTTKPSSAASRPMIELSLMDAPSNRTDNTSLENESRQ